MTEGTTLFGPKRLATAVAAAGMLLGSMGVGHAEPIASTPAHSAQIAASGDFAGPRFVPSRDAAFEESFDHLAAPLPEPEIPAHAVDITEIDPPVETNEKDLGRGVASYYGRAFAGRPTASGERFDPAQLTAAHKTLPFGSKVKVTNTSNGKSVVVRINDRGPFVKGRHIDLSRSAAEEIGLIRRGHGNVELALITN